MWLDAGLPPNFTRDGPNWNTNNFSEAAFRVFDTVFLESIQNKRYFFNAFTHCQNFLIPCARIDRLVTIIVEDFLPYYRYWPPGQSRPAYSLMRITREGHDLWAADNIAYLERHKYKVTYEV
jgi:hypothetical protein